MKKVILMLAFAISIMNSNAQDKNFIDQPYIEVTGAADTAINADEIYINIKILESDMKNKISIEEMEKKMVAALTSLGINTEKNLSAKDMQSNFKFYVLKQKDVMKSKEYVLKVSDAMIATKVFIKLEDLGIANTSIESIAYSKLNELKIQLRSKAALNAKQKALALAVPLGSSIDKVLHIVDYNTDGDEITNNGNMNVLMVRGFSSMPKNEDVENINFEKIKVKMNVNVKFALK